MGVQMLKSLSYRHNYLLVCINYVKFIFLMSIVLSFAYAQSAKDIAKRSFAEGRQAYKKGQYPQALKAFQYAYQKYPIPMMLFNIASTYEAMEQLPQALKNYQALVDTGKDDGDASKKVKHLKKQLSKWAQIEINSIPTQAQLYVNHTHYAPWGDTPNLFLLPPQEDLTLYLKAKGYQTLAYSVRFKKKEKKQITLRLKGKSAFVRIMGDPKKLTAKVNHKILKGLPIIYDLGVGQHEVDLFADGYLPEKRQITLTPIHTRDAPLSLEVKLRSSHGKALLVLDVKQQDVMLLVDGVPKGQSPFNGPIELKEGQHMIELKGPQGKSFRKHLAMKSGSTKTLRVDLLQSSFFTQKRVSLTLVSIGGASLITGLVTTVLALSSSKDLEDCRTQFSCARKQGELNLAQDVRGYSLSADIFTSIGLVLGVTGGVLYWLDRKSKALSTSHIMAIPTAGGAAAFAHFNF